MKRYNVINMQIKLYYVSPIKQNYEDFLTIIGTIIVEFKM